MAGNTRNLSIGARNPYALAELIRGEKINWKAQSCDRSISKLENAFGMPVERIFDPKFNSPLYRKDISEITKAVSESLSTGYGSSTPLMCLCLPGDWKQWTHNYITAAGMRGLDPVQSGLLSNCSLIAAIASCAWVAGTKPAWFKSVTSNAAVAGSYSLQFYDYLKPVPLISPSSKLPQPVQDNLIYAKSTKSDECWPSIIEKGYYMSRDRILRNIDSDCPDMEYYNDETINPTRDPPSVLFQLLNTEPVKRSKVLNGSDYNESMIWGDIKGIGAGRIPNLKTKYPAVAYTYDTKQGNWKTDTIPPKHTYSILGVTGTLDTARPPNWTSKYIVLRDTWGFNNDPSLSSPDVLTQGTWLSGIDFAAKDGIFALRSDLFPVYFQGYAYAVI
jgi:Calpain family cysteine protease